MRQQANRVMGVRAGVVGSKSGRESAGRRAAGWAALAIAAGWGAWGATAGTAAAQTSGTFTPAANNGLFSNVFNWETPQNWTGAIPGAGGVATFGEGQLGALTTFLSFTGTYSSQLSQLNFASSGNYQITGVPTGGVLVMAAGATPGLTLNVTRSATSGPNNFRLGHSIVASISEAQAGSVLIKTGSGNASLSGTNNWSGGTQILGGTLRATTPLAIGSGPITLSNATFRYDGASNTVLGNASPVSLGANATFQYSGGGTVALSGALTGTNGLTKTGTGVLTLSGDNATTLVGGTVYIRGAADTTEALTIQGAAGNISGVSTVDNAGMLNLDNTVTGGSRSNRVGPAVAYVSRGGELRINASGTGGTSATETFSGATLASGWSVVTLTVGTTSRVVAALPSLTRLERSTGLLRATILGTSTLAGRTNLTLAALPSDLTADGGTAVSRPIIPWLVGNTNAANSTLSTLAMTVDTTASNAAGTNFVRPLLQSEMVADLLSAGANDHVRLVTTGTTATSADVGASGKAVGSLNLSGGSNATTGVLQVTVTGTGALTLNTGVLITSSNQTNGGGSRIESPIVFGGGREGILHASLSLTTTGPISGTNGLTKSGAGTWTISGNGASSTYSGQTTINSATVVVPGSLPVNAASAFGISDTAIVLSGGSNAGSRLSFSTSGAVVDRPIRVIGNGDSGVVLGTATNTEGVTFNGGITLERTLTLDFPASAPAVFNGVISGSGRLMDNSTTTRFQSVVINGSNNYSGGTDIFSTHYQLGNDSALGSGPIFTNNLTAVGTVSATGGGVRTIANPLVMNGNIVFNSPAGSTLTLAGPVDLTGLNRTLNVLGTPVTLAGAVTGGVFTKTGPGTLILTSASNSTTGTSLVLEGTLQFGNATPSGLIPGPISVAATGSVVVNRTATLTTTFALTGPGTATFNGPASANLNGNNSLSQYTANAGTVTFGGDNSATNSIYNVNNGASMVFSGPIGTTPVVNVASGGSAVWARTLSAVTYNTDNIFNVAAGGSFVKQGITNSTTGQYNTTTFTGTQNVQGAVTVRTGTFQLGSGTASGSLGSPSLVTLESLGAMIWNRTDNVAYAGTIAGAGRISNAGAGTTTFSGNLTAFGGVVEATGGSAVLAPATTTNAYTVAATLSSVAVGAGASVVVTETPRATDKPKVLVTSAVSIDPAGLLDLENNDMIVTGGVASISSLRAAAANFLATGTAGLGSTSGTAFTTLAVFPNQSDDGSVYYSSYDGVAVTASDVIVKFTYVGDTNIDGSVDANDVVNLLEGLSNGLTGWQNGDLNYDGVVSAADYALLTAAAGNQSLGNLGNGSGVSNGGVGAVPEPASAGLLFAAGTALISRRRRR